MFFIQNRKKNSSETGRSLLELIAVVAIIGLLGVTSIKGYDYVTNKGKAHNLAQVVTTLVAETRSALAGGRSTVPERKVKGPYDQEITLKDASDYKKYFDISTNTDDKILCNELTKSSLIAPDIVLVNGNINGECPGEIRFLFKKELAGEATDLTYTDPETGEKRLCPPDAICTTKGVVCLDEEKHFENGKCQKDCAEAALVCNEAGDPTECKDGYYLNKKQCVACPEHATKCSDGETATACEADFYLRDGQCLECPENATCAGDTDDFVCDEGLEQNEDKDACVVSTLKCSGGAGVGDEYTGANAGLASDGVTQCKCPSSAPYWKTADSTCVASLEGITCTTQDDCGGNNSEYYCDITSWDINGLCTDGNTSYYSNLRGTCQKVSNISHTDATVTGLGSVRRSNSNMNWWTAGNWCQAQGKNLIDVKNFQIYRSGTSTLVVEGTTGSDACAKNKTCVQWCYSPYNQMWNGNTLTDATDANGERYQDKYSAVMKDLRVQFNSNELEFWTKSGFENVNPNFCEVFIIYANCSSAAWGSNRDYNTHLALCGDGSSVEQETPAVTCSGGAGIANTTMGDIIYLGADAGLASDGVTQCKCPTNAPYWNTTETICQAGITCHSQDDCGGTNSDHYCQITDFTTNGNCNYYTSATGTCQPTNTIGKETFAPTGGFTSSDTMNWWSANNWCLAQGTELADFKDLECYHSGTANLITANDEGYCCAKGKTCDYQPENIWIGTFSNASIALRQGGGVWIKDENPNSCYAASAVALGFMGLVRYEKGFRALCKGNSPTPTVTCSGGTGVADTTVDGVTYSGANAGLASDGTTQCKCPAGQKWDATNGCQAATEGATCTTQDDCGGSNSEYYCQITNYTHTGAWTESNTACYDPNSITGTCRRVSDVPYTDASVTSLGSVRLSHDWMNWWTANSWCQAQGKSLIDVKNFQAYRSGTNTLIVEGSTWSYEGCAQGKICEYWTNSPYNQMWYGNTLTNAVDANGEKYQDKYSAVIKDLRVKFNSNSAYLWTKSSGGNTNKNACHAFSVYLAYGGVNFNRRYEYGGFLALCK